MNWLPTLLLWLGLGGAGLAKPLPSLVCSTWTDKALVYVEGGKANCADGPVYLTGLPTSITMDDITITATTTGLTFSYLTGTGNVQACIDSQGRLYRGNPGC